MCICVCRHMCVYLSLCLKKSGPCSLLWGQKRQQILTLLPTCWGAPGKSLSCLVSQTSSSPSIQWACPDLTCSLCKAELIRTFGSEILEALGSS